LAAIGSSLNGSCKLEMKFETIVKRNNEQLSRSLFTIYMQLDTLSKIFGGQTKILGGQKVVKSDKCMEVSQLLL